MKCGDFSFRMCLYSHKYVRVCVCVCVCVCARAHKISKELCIVPIIDLFQAWRRKWQPTPLFLPGEACGQRNLTSYGP